MELWGFFQEGPSSTGWLLTGEITPISGPRQPYLYLDPGPTKGQERRVRVNSWKTWSYRNSGKQWVNSAFATVDGSEIRRAPVEVGSLSD